MAKVKFEINSFTEFMYILKDFDYSLHEWSSKDISNTWDMECELNDNGYVIYLTINESTNKSK